MGMDISAYVKVGNVLEFAPFEPFANNINVQFSNQLVDLDLDENDPYYEGYQQYKARHQQYPSFRATMSRRGMLRRILGVNFQHGAITFNPEEVKQNAYLLNRYNFDETYAMDMENFNSVIEFFEICAKEGYYISIV